MIPYQSGHPNSRALLGARDDSNLLGLDDDLESRRATPSAVGMIRDETFVHRRVDSRHFQARPQ